MKMTLTRNLLFLFGCLGLLNALPFHARAAAPALVSVTPADGATQVPTTSAITFVFDQDMDTAAPIPSGTGFWGGYDVKAPNFNQTLIGSWTDARTLKLQTSIQFPYATFTWTLNPVGGSAFVIARLKSKTGVELPTLSGTFTTGVGGTDPRLGSTFPVNNALGVRTNVQIQFRFDQVMKKIAITGNAIVWTGVGINGAQFAYTWSTDGKILYAVYTPGLPVNTEVSWALNPPSATTRLEGENGRFVATGVYSGKFSTAGPETACDQGALPDGWGSYSINKNFNFEQTSDADPLPVENAAFLFSAFVNNSVFGGTLTAASVTSPGPTQHPMQNNTGAVAQFFETFPTAAALEAAYPYGEYTLRFTQTGQPERVVTAVMTASTAPTPKIANFTQAQAINAAASFTLQWNAFPNPGPLDSISLYIADEQGNVVFQAPNPCIPRELPVTATSVVIPANTLRANETFTAGISFFHGFYRDMDDVPEMAGYFQVIRNTTFTVKTGGAVTLPNAAELIEERLLPNGNPEFKFTGTIGRAYRVERAHTMNSASWQTMGTLTVGASGQITFEDTEANKTYPLFYRVVADE